MSGAELKKNFRESSRLAALALLALPLIGCATLVPDTGHIAATHTSQPMRGAGPYPVGNDNALPETTYETVELALQWQHGAAFAESSIGYVLHQTDLTGGPWIFQCKAGIRFSLVE